MEHTLYDSDFVVWVNETVKQLRTKDFTGLDLDHLIEEIESLGNSEHRALRSQWIRVVKHLLKLAAQPQSTDYHNSWVSSVVEGLDQISDALQRSPSLRGYLRSNQTNWYDQARKQAAIETRLPPAHFAASCPFDIEELIAGIFPESVRYFFEPEAF